MPFSDDTKKKAFQRSRGQCECERTKCSHRNLQRCATLLTRHGAEYHHKTAESDGGNDDLSNCEVLCTLCHLGTHSYGSH